MIVSRTCTALALGLSALVTAVPARAVPPEANRWIVSTGKGPGAGGEFYWPSLRLLNSNPTDAPVELSFLPQSGLDASGSATGDNAGVSSVSIVVPAGQTLDLAPSWNPFGATGRAGAVRIASTGVDAQGRPLVVEGYSQTTVLVGEPAHEVLGPHIPTQGPGSLIAGGESAWVPFLVTGGWEESGLYRSNLFLLSTNADSNTVVTLTLVDYDNETRGSRDVTLGRLAQTQVNDVARFFGYVTCANGCPSSQPQAETFSIVATVRSGGPVAVGGVVIESLRGSSV